MDYLNKLRKNNNIKDLVYKEIIIENKILTIINIETITNNYNINEFILKKIDSLNSNINIYDYLYNNLPCINIQKVDNYNDMINLLISAYTIIIIDNQILAVETINYPLRGITESTSEKAITGPKDSFIENFNTNIGLIRKRIKSFHLKLEKIIIGKYSQTNIGIMYLDNVCKKEIKDKIINNLQKINIDGIILIYINCIFNFTFA